MQYSTALRIGASCEWISPMNANFVIFLIYHSREAFWEKLVPVHEVASVQLQQAVQLLRRQLRNKLAKVGKLTGANTEHRRLHSRSNFKHF